MNPYLELMRPYNGILAVLGVLIGAFVAGIQSPYLILAIIASFIINGAGNTINDYFDYKIDKINRPKRPIPSGRTERKRVIYYFFILSFLGTIASYFVSEHFFYIALLNIFISFIYSWKLKGTPLAGNIAVSWLASSTFLGGALVSNTFNSIPFSVLILSLISFLATMSREIVKDAEDLKGDKKFKLKTLPIVAGEKLSIKIASVLLLLSAFSLFIPVYYKLFGPYYMIGALPAFLLCILAIVKMKDYSKSQYLIKMSMYFVFIGFILGIVL